MEQLRLLLAAFAALLALVFFGVWWVRGRQRSTKGRSAVFIYGILLLSSSAFLFLRSQQEVVVTSTPRELKPENSKQPAATESQTTTQTTTQTNKIDTGTEVKTQPLTKPESNSVSESSAPIAASQTPQVVRQKAQANPRFVGPPMLELPKRKRDKSAEPEELVEATVLQAFEFIEVFFDKYATPSTEAAPSTSAPEPASKIEFLPGTAELSDRSLDYLRSLAPELSKIYKDGHLEIRAQSDESADSPAYRFLLTQSRAESVRDILAAGGFPANRLIPIGSESPGETRVKFVHRPN